MTLPELGGCAALQKLYLNRCVALTSLPRAAPKAKAPGPVQGVGKRLLTGRKA